MRFNVAQLLKEHSGATRHYQLAEDIVGLYEEITALAELVGNVDMLRTSEGILVTGHLHTIVEVPCDRCLEPAAIPIDIELEETFLPTVDVLTGSSLFIPDDADTATLIDAQHILDLTEVVRQAILLALPIPALCRPDCAGLCPECGQNLNYGSCSCSATVGDPRWATLVALFNSSNGGP